MRVSVVQGQKVIFLFDGEGQEDELDATAFLPNDDPGAVGPVGVAVGETRRLDAAVSALQCTAASVDKTCKGETQRTLLVSATQSEML